MINQHPGFDVTKNYNVNTKLIEDAQLMELYKSGKLMV